MGGGTGSCSFCALALPGISGWQPPAGRQIQTQQLCWEAGLESSSGRGHHARVPQMAGQAFQRTSTASDGQAAPGRAPAGKEQPLLTTCQGLAGGESLTLGKEVPEVPGLWWGAEGELACERGSCSATS